MPESPFYNFPRFYPMRGGGGGPKQNAISQFGDDIAGALMQIKAGMDQKKQDELANAMMNNGQSPGAAPYVRRATYPDGDQGDDPGPIPFDSTDTPHSGGQSQAQMLAQNAAQQQKAQQMQLAQAMATRAKPMSEYEAYQVANPDYIPGSGRRQFAPTRAPGQPRGSSKKSNMLPPSLGDDNLPTNEPAMPSPPDSSAPSLGQKIGAGMDANGGILGSIVAMLPGLFGGGGSSPDATPSPTPLVAQGGIPSVSSDEDFHALPSGTKFRDPKGKIRVKP